MSSQALSAAFKFDDYLKHRPIMLDNGRIAIVALSNRDRGTALSVLDISNTASPSVVKEISLGSYSASIADFKVTHDEGLLLVSVGNEVLIYDIDKLYAISLKGRIEINGAAGISISKDDRFMYVVGCIKNEYCTGIALYDLRENYKFLNFFDVKDVGLIALSKNSDLMAFSRSGENSVVLADISNKGRITKLSVDSKTYNNRGSWKTSGRIEDMTFSEDGKYLYVAGNEVGLVAYDVSRNNLNKITQSGGAHWALFFNTTQAVYSVYTAKNKLYLAGTSSNKMKEITPIASTEKTILLRGDYVSLSSDGSVVAISNIYAKPTGLRFMKIKK